MRQPRIKLAAIAALSALLGAALVGPILAAPAAVSAESTARAVTGATLAWSLNDESGSAAYFGGCNFLSAGVAANAGKSRLWSASDGLYRVSDGNVRIEKATADGYEPPSFATKCQDASGTTVTSGNNRRTGNRVVIADGEGWLDLAAGTAEIRWSGSFTVAYYGGMTYWSASDPILQVRADGSARLTATLSGYGADMEDATKWSVLPPHVVELATFRSTTAVEPEFTAKADYVGVTVSDHASRVPQVARTADNAAYWGSFPASFIDYQTLTGQSAYWYSSGGLSDQNKVAHDLSVADMILGDDGVKPSYTDIPIKAILPSENPKPSDPVTPTQPDDDKTTKDDGDSLTSKVTVKDAVLRWGLNAETSSAAFFGGCNFLSAGQAGNNDAAKAWTQSSGLYKAASGNVEILKPNSRGKLERATWATKCHTRTGTAVSNGNSATTESIVSISGGTGTLNPKKGTAKIAWKGSFTVAFYGGMTYWYAKNPVLTVAKNGSATLTATAGGYASSMDDATKWSPLKDRKVTLANLTGVDVSAAKGFTITPEYLGVSVKAGGGEHSAQAAKTTANAGYWGSFPQSFIDFHLETGQSAYWYTSGGSRDWAKPAAALTVTYDAANVKNTVKKKADKGEDSGSRPSTATVVRPSTLPPASTPTAVLPPSGAVTAAGATQNSSRPWPTTQPVALAATAQAPVVRAELASTTAPTDAHAALTGGFIALGIALFAGALALAPFPSGRRRG